MVRLSQQNNTKWSYIASRTFVVATNAPLNKKKNDICLRVHFVY